MQIKKYSTEWKIVEDGIIVESGEGVYNGILVLF